MRAIKYELTVFILLILSSNSYSLGLNSVYSKDGNNVWSVGLTGLVIYSTDGGNVWNNISLGSTTYNSVCANSQYVWIAGNSGILQISSDNGVSWTQYTLGGGVNLKSVFFINSATGWIACDNGKILKSTNSGLSWTTQITPVINNLNCVTFTDNLTGAACGAGGTVLLTTNGGSSWAISPTTVTQELLSVDIKAPAIIVSGIDRTVIISTNSGSSWGIIDYKIQTRVDINSVFMFDQNTYFSCGNDGFIRKSTDRGATFQYLPNLMLADLNKIFFFNSNTGWAAGKDNNVVIRTTDGGNSWQIPPGVNQVYNWYTRFNTDPYGSWGNIFSLSKQNPSEIFVCANRHIYRSLNYGQTFQTIPGALMPVGPTGIAPHSFIISPLDSNKMLVAYDSLDYDPPYIDKDKILRTTDYGTTWQVSTSLGNSVDSNPLTIDPNHPDTVYLAGGDSLVYRSTNFGLNWSATGSTHLGKICTMHVVKGNSNIILCGSEPDTNTAITYRSTDYGLTWNIVFTSAKINIHEPPEVPAIISNIAFPQKIFMTAYEGTNNGLHVSTDEGLTWTRNYIDTNAWGFGIAEDDPNLMVIGDDGSVVHYLSVNSGINWSLLPASFPENQSMMCFNHKIILAQQHNSIIQLVPTYNLPIGIQPISNEVPKKFSLHQNYPNPFNPSTKIKFEIPAVGTVPRTVRMIIYNSLGQEVTTLVNEQLIAGVYEVNWDAANFPSGVYFYFLQTSDFSESKKMILIK